MSQGEVMAMAISFWAGAAAVWLFGLWLILDIYRPRDGD